MTVYIPKTECVDRRLYRIYARNLRIGVYNAKTGGFLGLRTKFDSLFVFEEYHWDNGPPFGTVKPIEALPEDLPSDILVSERLPGYFCAGNYPIKGCDRALSEGVEGKFYYRHMDGGACLAGDLVRGNLRPNDPLFNWLKEMETKYPSDLQWCNKE